MAKAGHAKTIAGQHRIFGAAVGVALYLKKHVQVAPVSTIRRHFIGHIPKGDRRREAAGDPAVPIPRLASEGR
jgi:hypothetical protein